MNVEELKSLNIGEPFIAAWRRKGIEKLTEIQAIALNDASLRGGSNVIIVAPTSSGKTFIGEVLALRAASTLHRALYLVPFKALAEEKYLEFSEAYRPLGISVVVSSSDHSEFDTDIRRGDFGIAVLVYEKLAQLLVQSPGIVSDCYIAVIDEVQLIREKERGPLLEMLLTRIKRLHPSPQIVCLSATVAELGGFDRWMGAKVIQTANRPVPLWEGVISESPTITLHNMADSRTRDAKSGITGPLTQKEDILDALITSLPNNEQALIFRTQVDETERTALRLAAALPAQPVAGQTRGRIAALEDTPLRAFLDRYIDRGVAYHNAGLAVEERRLVESLFREGTLRIVVATATLAAGVNLPADIVVMADYHRYDMELRTRVAIDVAEYKNCAGRAGRYGKRSQGTCLILADAAGQTAILERQYIYGNLPKLESAIPKSPDLAHHVLKVVAERIATDIDDITELFRDSFAFVSYYVPSGYEEELIREIKKAATALVRLGLIDETGKGLQVTALGKIAARSGVSVGTFGALVPLCRKDFLESADDQQILQAITGVTEMEPLRPYSPQQRAELLARWVAGDPISTLIKDYSTGRYGIGYGRVSDLGSVAEWLLQTAAQIAETLGLPVELSTKLDDLARRAHFGVPTRLVQLAQLRAIHRTDLLRLVHNEKGVELTDPCEIIEAEPSRFNGILSPQQAAALKDKIAQSITDSLLRRKTGHLLRCDRLAVLRPIVESVYEARGNDFDRALEDLTNAPNVDLGAHRFTRQRTGQPDLEIQGLKGTIVISATASEDDRKPISWDKSREILGCVGYSGNRSNSIVIGRPEFHKIAIDNARELASRGTEDLLLAPVDVIVELCLRKVEGKLSRDDLIRWLEDQRGYLGRDDLDL